MAVRVGQGFDVHAFDPGLEGPLVLGGVDVPESPRLGGHSDGDVLLHALADALLGAAGLGDLGELVGIDDPDTRGASSTGFVRTAWERVARAGWAVGNADLTVIARQPRLGPYRTAMRASVAGLLDVPEAAVGLKATTTDGLGALGRGDGIACLAVVLLERASGAEQ